MRALIISLLLVVVCGCSYTARAPVQSRTTAPEPAPSVSRPSGGVVTRPARPIRRPAAREAGQYTVRRGDTLYSVAWQHGLTIGELARQNGIQPPYTIYPGQRLRVRAPTRPVAPVQVQPLPGSPPPSAPPPVATAPAPAAPTPVAPEKSVSKQPVAAEPATSGTAGFDGQWVWPTRGRLLRGFKSGGSGKKGIDIGGHHAQPVKAAASGKVVYAGSGLVGYGRLIIVKHNENLLSAYGHNSKLLVAEGDHVKAGDMIAQMGNSGTNRTALYFEIRKDGKPVNPLHYLPRN